MKHFNEYFFESLSKESIKKLEQYISDENVDEYIKLLKRHASKSGIKEDDYTVFFDKHGISELNWGRKNSAVKQFVNLFSEEDHLDILTKIVKDDGVVSIDDIKETGNIFKDYCSEFSEEAKIIASWTNSKSANAGPCELLLKFIIKEANSKKTGDVTIHNDEEMEVKASTLKGKSSGSGGHAAGQRGKIRNTWAVYYYLNNNVFNIETSNSEADKLKYFQNKDGVQELNNVIKDKGLSIEEVTNGIVDALCFQYNFITNENDVKNELKTKDKLYKAALNIAKSISKNNEFNSSNDVFNLVGCIQLYLYSQIEGFDYFFAVLVDKNIDNESDNNGFYFCVKNCQDDNSELLNFDKILSYISFGGLDSTTSSQGRTGKIYIKKN